MFPGISYDSESVIRMAVSLPAFKRPCRLSSADKRHRPCAFSARALPVDFFHLA